MYILYSAFLYLNRVLTEEPQNPDDTQQIAKKSNTNSVPFICPAGGQVRCQANFNDNDDGPNYSLRGKYSLFA